MDLINGLMNLFGGVRIIEDSNMHDKVPDWSACRSPSRSKRRHRQGHKTRMFLREEPWTRAYQLPNGTLAMHPSMARKLKAAIQAKESSHER
jgi:hypothetical protein